MQKFAPLTLVILILIFPLMTFSQSNSWNVKNQELHDGWQIQTSSKVKAKDQAVSTLQFHPTNWYAAKVPNSTLGSLVGGGVFKDVFFDRNLEKIPDSLFDAPWWYRRAFTIQKINPGQVYRLGFDGISYRADVWLNGHKIASADSVEGSFRQFTFDVTPFVKPGENVLALKVTKAGPAELNIGFVDWNPEPADNNMGIWRPVHLLETGPVSISHPFIITDVDTATLDHANVSIKVTLQNHSGKKIDGVLNADIEKSIRIARPVTLEPHETKDILLTPGEYKALSIDHPKLWWTHDLGEPFLYSLQLNFESNHQLSDQKKINFGIRSVSDYRTDSGFRAYRLNGKKILIKGGGWTDPMLLNSTKRSEEAGVDYAVHMGLNALRMEGFWGENQHLYDLCDEKGILLMVGFSCQWEWKGIFGGTYEDKYGCIVTPHQIDVAQESWRDQLLWLRNHPSIFLWLYGSDKWPRPELEQKYLDVLAQVDPTRPYAQSAKEWTSVLTGKTGMKMRGPYDYVPPSYWYIDSLYGGNFGFNTETGPGPEIPVLESLKKMIPKDSLWPISQSWLYHAARGNFHNFKAYNNAMDQRLGEPSDLHDYLRKAQLLNYEGMRAMFEAFESNRFKSTGIIQWMYNSSWPKLWWQLYDYFLMPTSALYGARIANEPMHISYNYGKNSVEVMNNTQFNNQKIDAQIRIFDIDGKIVTEKSVPVSGINSLETKEIFTLPDMNVGKTFFLDLRLWDKDRHAVSINDYVLSTQKDELNEKKSTWWITPQSQYADLTLLEKLPDVKLEKTETVLKKGENTEVKLKLKNPTSHIAFMTYLDLKKEKNNESVVPVFWSDNYITLFPGEERTVTATCHTSDLGGQNAKIVVSGWNVK